MEDVNKHAFIQMCVHVCVQPYLKVGELGVVKVRVDVQRGAHH